MAVGAGRYARGFGRQSTSHKASEIFHGAAAVKTLCGYVGFLILQDRWCERSISKSV
jgi:hypothetical protein